MSCFGQPGRTRHVSIAGYALTLLAVSVAAGPAAGAQPRYAAAHRWHHPLRAAQASSPTFTITDDVWRRTDRALRGARPRVAWRGEPLIAPRGIMQMGQALYLTDPGSGTAGTRIVKFPLVGQREVGAPSIFYSDPGFLVNAKWSIPVPRNSQGITGLVVADQGTERRDGTFTGEGAKVFRLPILADGRAGTPVLLAEGRPLVCPTGVAVVPPFVYVSDPCAGPLLSRSGVMFAGSALFAIPLAGGAPRLLWQGDPFTSMVGICAGDGTLGPNGRVGLTVHDTDSGRPDPTGAGGRPGFAPPAAAELWVFDVLNSRTAKLASPRRISFTEEGRLTLRFKRLPSRARISVELLNAMFPDQRVKRTYRARDVGADRKLTIRVASQVRADDVRLRVRIRVQQRARRVLRRRRRLAESRARVTSSVYEPGTPVGKDPKQSTQFVDNKHGGRVVTVSAAAAGAARQRSLYRVSLDSAPGHAAVWIFSEQGGTPVALARGEPMIRPLGARISPDQRTLWISDSSGALLWMELPSARRLAALFPYRSRPIPGTVRRAGG